MAAVPPPTYYQELRQQITEISNQFLSSPLIKLVWENFHYRNLGRDIVNIGSNFFNIFKFQGINLRVITSLTSNTIWRQSTILQRIGHCFRSLAAIIVPFCIYKIGMEIKELCKKGSDRIGGVLRISEWVAWGSFGIATTLAAVYAIIEKVSSLAIWAFSFHIVSLVCSVAAIIRHSRNLYLTLKTKRQLGLPEPNANFEKLDFAHRFGTHNNQLKEDFDKIQAKSLESNNCYLGQRSIVLLKERLKTKAFSDGLAILASLVQWVGMAILLFTPFTSAASIVMIGSALISAGKFVYNEHSLLKTQKLMKELIVCAQ